LVVGSAAKKSYLKISYYRMHSEQNINWLNSSTTIATVLKFAPIKGESQLAFHSSAKEMFTLQDTKPDQKDPAKRKGYGARNKSYLFKEGEAYSPKGTQVYMYGNK
jgi:hypothetical protein